MNMEVLSEYSGSSSSITLAIIELTVLSGCPADVLNPASLIIPRRHPVGTLSSISASAVGCPVDAL